MALSKLHSFPFFSPQTPLATQKSPISQLSFLPSTNPFPLQLKTLISRPPILLPTKEQNQQKNPFNYQNIDNNPDSLSVAFPSLAFSNTLFFNSAYNVQVIVGDHEPEEKLIGRFRREVFRAGVIQECKRRKFFETSQEKRKRKKREAARRNRKRRPPPKGSKDDKAESPKKKEDSSDKDNWEFLDVGLPYC